MKAYTSSTEELKRLLADGYHVVSIAYFTSNPVVSYILEKK